MDEKDSDALEHKDVVHSHNVDIVDPLFFELIVGIYVAGDLGTTRLGERSRYTNLNVLRLISLVGGHKMTHKDVSIRESCNVKSFLWVVFLNCRAGREFWICPSAMAATWREARRGWKLRFGGAGMP